MVVDDSAVIRGLITRWIEAEPDMTVAASVRTGLDAINQVARVDPDIMILDIEMPDMDGISALPLLLEKKRNLVVIMASTLTRRNAEISFRALALGASDYIPKPESKLASADEFRRDLVGLLHASLTQWTSRLLKYRRGSRWCRIGMMGVRRIAARAGRPRKIRGAASARCCTNPSGAGAAGDLRRCPSRPGVQPGLGLGALQLIPQCLRAAPSGISTAC